VSGVTTDPTEFGIDIDGSPITARHFPAAAGSPLLILAHGAGADQRHRFMVTTAQRLTARGVSVVTFNFLYTEHRRGAPDRAPVLEETWTAVVDEVVARLRPHVVAVGGKSMGGRIASQVLASRPESHAWQRVGGLALLGYPLHPPGQPHKMRAAHLPDIDVPILVVQGARDAFGTREEIETAFHRIKARVDYEFIENGDHSFAVPKSSGRSESDILDGVADRVSAWLLALPAS
jgi:hypothetical protein